MNFKSRNGNPVYLNKPYINGYMSANILRQYHSDLSQLKYLTSIPAGALNYDLNHNIDKAVKRTTDDNDEKITLLLSFILDQKHRLNFLFSTALKFITYRRTLISVMCSPFNHETILISACLFKNSIYLCSLESTQEKLRRKSRNRQEDKFCAWGYKFEQYMLADTPSQQPDINKPVVENEEFSLYYCSQLGNHRLFYGAQIDSMMATTPVPSPPNNNDIETNLNYLRNNNFVELKTNREIFNKRQEQNFKKYKLLRCWCQCYLAGLQGLLVGYRTDEGIVTKVEWFNTKGIVRYCKYEWDPQTCVDYLNYFLTFIEDTFNKIKASGDYSSDTPVTLKIEIDERRNIHVNRDVDQDAVILPDWYVNKMTAQSGSN